MYNWITRKSYFKFSGRFLNSQEMFRGASQEAVIRKMKKYLDRIDDVDRLNIKE